MIPGSWICWRRKWQPTPVFLGFARGSAGKESACSAGDLGSIREEGKGYPLQYSGLESSIDYVVHGSHKESDTTDRLSLSLSLIYSRSEILSLAVSNLLISLSEASFLSVTYFYF